MMTQELKSKTNLKVILLDHLQAFHFRFQVISIYQSHILAMLPVFTCGTEETDSLMDTGNTKKMIYM